MQSMDRATFPALENSMAFQWIPLLVRCLEIFPADEFVMLALASSK